MTAWRVVSSGLNWTEMIDLDLPRHDTVNRGTGNGTGCPSRSER